MTTPDEALDPTQRLQTQAGPKGADVDGDAAVLPPGARIGRYRIEAVLGSGGMGEVYRAEQLEPVRRIVALKRLRQHRLDARQLAWFEIERQVLAQMQHPAIAQIYDAGTDAGGAPFFAMEYIEGESLLRYCESARLGLRERLELLIRVCEGVQHAHQKGVIHRDLKPANILVSTIDGRALPRIIDFGIATATSRSLALGKQGEVVGTPDYMSPEQAGLSPHAVDLRSDVFALGVILYELLTGARPGAASGDAGATQRTTLRAPSHALDTLPDAGAALARRHGLGGLAQLRRSLREDLDWITLKAIAEDRDTRYASVAALAEDLRNHLADRPVAASPGGRRYRTGKFVRRHRLALGAAAMVLLALFAGLGLSLYGLWQADAQRRTAEARGRELEQVVAFQQAMLKGIDIRAMGDGLIAAQRAQLEDRLAGDADREATLAGFDASMRHITAPDLARTLVDRFVLTGALTTIEEGFAGQPQLAADLRASAADVYMAIGAYGRAIEIRRQVLDARRAGLGDEALASLRAQLELGAALHNGGRLDEARALQEPLYRLGEARGDLPAELRDAIAAAYALTLSEIGETNAALDVQNAALARIVSERGEHDEAALKLRGNVAISLARAGRREEARDHFEALLALRRERFGPDAGETVNAMTNVAAIRGALGDHAGALPLLREVYEARRRQYGEEHSSTLIALGNLAGALSNVGRMDEALPAYERAIEISRQVLGPTHPETLRGMQNLASALTREERFDEALPRLQEVLRLRREVLGPQHPDTVRTATHLAQLLGKMERFDEALPLAEASLRMRRAMSGETHPDTIEARFMLADINIGRGDARSAVADLDRAMTLEVSEAQHLNIARHLYEARVEAGDEAQASALRRDVLDVFLARDPATLDPVLQNVRERMLEDLRAQDDDAAGGTRGRGNAAE